MSGSSCSSPPASPGGHPRRRQPRRPPPATPSRSRTRRAPGSSSRRREDLCLILEAEPEGVRGSGDGAGFGVVRSPPGGPAARQRDPRFRPRATTNPRRPRRAGPGAALCDQRDDVDLLWIAAGARSSWTNVHASTEVHGKSARSAAGQEDHRERPGDERRRLVAGTLSALTGRRAAAPDYPVEGGRLSPPPRRGSSTPCRQKRHQRLVTAACSTAHGGDASLDATGTSARPTSTSALPASRAWPPRSSSRARGLRAGRALRRAEGAVPHWSEPPRGVPPCPPAPSASARRTAAFFRLSRALARPAAC